MDMSQYLQVFIDESKENLQSLNEHLLRLESVPSDIQIVNEVFRVAHTLKGMSGTMGFVNMQKLTHHVENVLAEIRSGKMQVTSEMLDVLFRSLDALEGYVEEIISTSSEGDKTNDELIKILDQIIKGQFSQTVEIKPQSEVALPEEVIQIKQVAIQGGMNVLRVIVTLEETCVLKSARAFVVFSELGRIGEIIYAQPSVQEIEDEQFDRIFTIVCISLENKTTIEEAIMKVSEVERVEVIQEKEEQSAISQVIQSEIVTKQPGQEKEIENTAKNKQQVSTKSVRVNIDRLDTLMNLVSELIIVKTQLEGASKTIQGLTNNYHESIEYLERITTNLHDAVMKVRMVPVESVFNRFPRMIRDVARKLDKDIDLVILGEETELDRTVIDEIGDPLIHLLRNAADHGLETSKERINLGKNPKGTIRLQAFQDGNSVVIEVEDDGKGIDVEKVRNKAIERNTLPREVLSNMSDQEVIELLFSPSFSTAEKVTDLSGRGVGLDVVKSKITALGGDVEIKSELGKGSRFTVRLPLTLAIIEALMVNIGEEKYAIPLGNIQNIEAISKCDIKFVQKQEVMVLRNQVIPIVRLRSTLDIPEQETEHMMIVIAKKGEKQVGFVVDSLIGQQEIVIKPLGKYLNQIHMIAGATILGNGEVALILDINTLV